MSEIATIYLTLVDENVDVRRPVRARHIQGNVYLILEQPYDRNIERWAFEPGDIVICEAVSSDDGVIFVATGLASEPQRGPTG
jgi:hypothetical protein